jgi:hypothetical protein
LYFSALIYGQKKVSILVQARGLPVILLFCRKLVCCLGFDAKIEVVSVYHHGETGIVFLSKFLLFKTIGGICKNVI